mmetsp:Transcript_11529/g.27077  ORF Transcript_11529/g.27077 Transcript_11529/m.27077 type:complete len:85 (+) Transcript_11529:208-462(+)
MKVRILVILSCCSPSSVLSACAPNGNPPHWKQPRHSSDHSFGRCERSSVIRLSSSRYFGPPWELLLIGVLLLSGLKVLEEDRLR